MSRVTTSKGYNISEFQHISNGVPAKVEMITLTSSTTPVWGNSFQIEYDQIDTTLHKVVLGINLPVLTGTGSSSLIPASLWVNKVDISQGGSVKETLYGESIFLLNNLLHNDATRKMINFAQGNYSSDAQRANKCDYASTYYIDLHTYINQANIDILDPKDKITFKFYLDSLVNVVDAGSVPVCPILSANLYCTVTRLEANDATQRRLAIYKKPHHYKWNELYYQNAVVPSGTTTANITLTSLNGNYSMIMFVCRPSASLNNNARYHFDAISSFELSKAGGKNICGGSPISSSTMLMVLGAKNFPSSYLSENSNGDTNLYQNVYCYTFSSDIASTMDFGHSYGSMHFNGSENLKIVFPSALGASEQVDIFAFGESVIEVTGNGVNKRSYVQ